MIKTVIIGFAHMHVNEVALYISQQEDMELCAIADVESGIEKLPELRYTQGWNLRNVQEKYCSHVYDDYETMLDEVKPQWAFILCENSEKPRVVASCAKRGVNVAIEKPIAMNLTEAKKIEKVCKDSGIDVMVNWPVLWRPYIHRVKAALDSKLVGDPVELRYINGHTGPLGKGAKHRGVTEKAEEMTDAQREKTWWHNKKYGGGAFLDICCYGCLFAKWFLGDGETGIYAHGAQLNTPYGDAEDNLAAIIRYEGKKMAVIEGTWSTPRAEIPSGPMVLCTEGAIVCTGGAENMPDVKAYDMYGNEIPVPEFSESEAYKNLPAHYMSCLQAGKPIHEMLTLSKNMEVMAILDAAIRSNSSGCEEKIQ